MATGAALIEAGKAATAATEALRERTQVTAAPRRLNLADHAAILEALKVAPPRMFGPLGVLWRTARLIEVRRADYAADPTDDGRQLAEALSTVYEHTGRAIREARAVRIDAASDQLQLDVTKLAVGGSRAPKPVRRRHRGVVTCAGEAWRQIHSFAGAVPGSDGTIGDVETAVACAADIVLALKLTCHQEMRLVESAYTSAGIERSAAHACDMLRSAWAALSLAHRALCDATEVVAGPAQLEKTLLECGR